MFNLDDRLSCHINSFLPPMVKKQHDIAWTIAVYKILTQISQNNFHPRWTQVLNICSRYFFQFEIFFVTQLQIILGFGFEFSFRNKLVLKYFDVNWNRSYSTIIKLKVTGIFYLSKHLPILGDFPLFFHWIKKLFLDYILHILTSRILSDF